MKRILQYAFPKFPESLETEYSCSNLSLGIFGRHNTDLEISFDSLTKPELITQIIYSCTRNENGKPPSPDFLWQLPVSTRIECVLLISLMVKSGEIEHILQCKNEQCSEDIGITLTQENVSDLLNQINRSKTISVRIQGNELTFRRPTGADQLRWLQKTYNTKSDITKEIIRTLIMKNEAEITEEQFSLLENSAETISKIMQLHDPLINLNLTISCPYCKKTANYSLDIQELALDVLRKAQQELIDSIHYLALNYHWSEQEILSLPIWRRRKYLSLIGRTSQ